MCRRVGRDGSLGAEEFCLGCNMTNEQLNSPETICSRCGAEARWSFVDQEKQTVEVICPDCGRFEIPVAEFEQAEFDIAPAEERRQ